MQGTAAEPVRPTIHAVVVAGLLAAIGALVALTADKGDAFIPRVETLDALAGLTIGAFVVERLVTFMPPLLALGARGNRSENSRQKRERIKKRAADVAFIRVGYGFLIGGLFVMVTDLRAVKVLSPEGATETVHAGVDRLIAAAAIAGGVAGLASLLSGLNPPAADTDPAAATKGAAKAINEGAAKAAGEDERPAPKPVASLAPDWAYIVGFVALAVAALIAILGANDKTGLELIGSPQQPDAAGEDGGTVELVVRFGIVILLAGVIQQVIERLLYPFLKAVEIRKIVTGAVAVVLGVIAANLVDLYLLHNVGFFGVGSTESINDGIAASSKLERWFDTFVTGVAIAAGTRPLHDLSAGIKKRAAAKTPAS